MIGKTSRHARRLRQNSTEAEQLLWQRLRNRQLAGAKFRRQATIGRYVVDFLCVDAALIVEADGGQHSPDRDANRTAWLEAKGLRVARFWNNDILENIEDVLLSIFVLLQENHPHPTLSRQRERASPLYAGGSE